jgi:hypothetical protein
LLAGALYLITFIGLVSRPGSPSKEQKTRLLQRARNSPDFRFLSGTGWNIVDETTVPITLFGAGATIETA